MTKQEIVSKLLEASDAYYNKSAPIMTDAEYDRVYDEFKSTYPNDPFLKTIGAPVSPATDWQKANHKISMGSLNKVVNEEEFNQWLSIPYDVCISLKLDGISVNLEYENGKLVRGISRGDGYVGEDITLNVRKMQNVKENLPNNFTGSLRGEIILTKKDFDLITTIQQQRNEEPIKNMRNGASGIAKRYDNHYSEYLSIIYYDITGDFTLKTKKFLEIENFGLPTAIFIDKGGLLKPFNKNEVNEIYELYENKLRSKLNYLVDGIVIEINDLKKYNELGEKDGRPRGSVAWKFTSKRAIAKVIGVTWEIGNNGRITPVIHIEPTDLDGITVRKMTSHNLDFFNNLKLYKGCRLLFQRSGDVIPIPLKIIE